MRRKREYIHVLFACPAPLFCILVLRIQLRLPAAFAVCCSADTLHSPCFLLAAVACCSLLSLAAWRVVRRRQSRIQLVDLSTVLFSDWRSVQVSDSTVIIAVRPYLLVDVCEELSSIVAPTILPLFPVHTFWCTYRFQPPLMPCVVVIHPTLVRFVGYLSSQLGLCARYVAAQLALGTRDGQPPVVVSAVRQATGELYSHCPSCKHADAEASAGHCTANEDDWPSQAGW